MDFYYVVNVCKFQKDGTIKEKGKLVSLSLAHKNQLKKEITRAKLEGNALKGNYSQWLENTKTNILQKLHFIIGHGILWPELRYQRLYKDMDRQKCVYLFLIRVFN